MAEFAQGLVNALTGSINQMYARNAAQAQQDEESQRAAFTTMLKSGDPELASLGLTGLMTPGKKNIFGQLKKNPAYEQIRSIVGQLHQTANQPDKVVDAPVIPGGAQPKPISNFQAAGVPGRESTGAFMGLTPDVPTQDEVTQGDAVLRKAAGAPQLPAGGQGMPGGGQPAPNPMASAGLVPPTTGAAPPPPGAPPGMPGLSADQQSLIQTLQPDQGGKVRLDNPAKVVAALRLKALSGDPHAKAMADMAQMDQANGVPWAQTHQRLAEAQQNLADPMNARLQMAQAMAQARANQQVRMEGVKEQNREQLLGKKQDFTGTQNQQKYRQQIELLDKRFGQQEAMARLRSAIGDQKVSAIEVPDPDDPNGIRTIKVPLSQGDLKALRAGGGSLEGKLPGMVLNRMTSAASAKGRLQKMIEDLPELESHIGPLMGRVSSFEDLAGSQDPVIQRFLTNRSQAAAYLTSVHSARGKAFLDSMENAIGQLKDNPAALETALQESLGGTEDFLSTVRPARGGVGEPPPTKPGASPGASPNLPSTSRPEGAGTRAAKPGATTTRKYLTDNRTGKSGWYVVRNGQWVPE